MFIAYGITKYTLAPAGRHVLERNVRKQGSEVKSVGVGFPNPSGKVTRPYDSEVHRLVVPLPVFPV